METRVADADAAAALMLETSLPWASSSRSTRAVLDLDSAMGPITTAVAYAAQQLGGQRGSGGELSPGPSQANGSDPT